MPISPLRSRNLGEARTWTSAAVSARTSTAAGHSRWTPRALGRGGKPIIALPATAKGRTVSRIVPTLKEGAGVVTSRAHVHYVATEFGVAYLHGRSIRERVQALIGIADPAFREELGRYARERLGLSV